MTTLTGRRLAHASGQTDITPTQMMAYRERWAAQGYTLPELAEQPTPAAVSRVDGVGKILTRRLSWLKHIGSNASGCKACKTLASQMDKRPLSAWTAEQIDADAADIAHRRGRLATLLPEVISVAVIRHEIQAAVDEHRAALEALPKRKPRTPGRRRRPSQPLVRLANSPTIPAEPIPFTGKPRLTLMFHVWPHGEGWRRHIEKLAPILDRFDRKLLGVATDVTTATAAETVAAFGDGWEVFAVTNDRSKTKGLREVATYQQMLPTLELGANDVTFCGHGKGAQDHTSISDPVTWWTDAMYQTVFYNIDGVIAEMESGASIVGSFRRHGGHFKTQYHWHYTGTFYSFRNCHLTNGHPAYRQKWWGTESWPGDHFPLSSSACIFGDNAGHLYHEHEQPRAELEAWKRDTT